MQQKKISWCLEPGSGKDENCSALLIAATSSNTPQENSSMGSQKQSHRKIESGGQQNPCSWD